MPTALEPVDLSDRVYAQPATEDELAAYEREKAALNFVSAPWMSLVAITPLAGFIDDRAKKRSYAIIGGGAVGVGATIYYGRKTKKHWLTTTALSVLAYTFFGGIAYIVRGD